MEWLFYTLVYAVLMGFTTKIIINNKGYDDNWFWWGFWFGVFAVVVACAKPQNIKYTSSSINSQSSGLYNYRSSDSYSKESDRIRNREILNAGGWQCPCGRVNASYVSTCTCGRNKSDVKSLAYKKEEQKKEAEVKSEAEAQKEAEAKKQIENMDESAKVSAIKGYKELHDEGIITQEEFAAQKKQLLGL